jgi:hypothetical protein
MLVRMRPRSMVGFCSAESTSDLAQTEGCDHGRVGVPWTPRTLISLLTLLVVYSVN